MIKILHCVSFLSNNFNKSISSTFLKDFKILNYNTDETENMNMKILKTNKLYNDYIKFNILYNQGGLLIDKKIKVIKNLDIFFEHDMFLGFCDDKNIGTNIIWCKNPKNEYVKKLLDKIEENVYSDITDVFSAVLGKNLKANYNSIVNMDNKLFIYPYDYFYPIDYTNCGKDISENLKTIIYEKSNVPFKQNMKLFCLRVFGLSGYRYIVTLIRTLRFKLARRKYLLKEKFRDKVLKSKDYQKQINSSIDVIDKYYNKEYIIMHNPRWLGVTSATKELFENLVPLQEIYNKKDAKRIAEKIVSCNIKQVIFSAFCFGWEDLAKELKSINGSIKIKVFWHGSNSQVIDEINWKTNTTAILLHKEGIIDVFATCKESILNFYKSQGYKTAFIMNTVRLPEKQDNDENNIKSNKDEIKIGLYAAGLDWRKNMYNQLAAISLIKNSIADIIPLSYEAKVFARKNNLKIDGLEKGIKRDDLLKRIALNDINLYVTFSECAPMLPIESMEMGIVCLTGDNNHYFKNTELEKYLIVDREDDIVYISEKIKYALENKEIIMNLYKEWKKQNDILSLQSVKNFLKM
jgi:glycosyltransferase involved in cell wall biosynthesis